MKAFHLMFLLSLANWFSAVNRDLPKKFVGVGAFNLVRGPAYRQCGGYEKLRLTVLDDMKLGYLLRRDGKKTRAFLGAGDLECDWGKSAWSAVKLMEKNYFAAIDYRLEVVIAGACFVAVIGAILLAGLVSGSPVGIAAALSPFAISIPAFILARRLGWSALPAILTPFMIPVFFAAALNSTCKTISQGGIRWRNTFYSLKDLRAGNVRTL